MWMMWKLSSITIFRQDIEYYVHRIRQNRPCRTRSRSFTFANSREIYKIREIERVCHTTITEKKLPGAAKVLKAKADKYLNKAWELHEHEDIELMKSFYSGSWKRKAAMHWSWQQPC